MNADLFASALASIKALCPWAPTSNQEQQSSGVDKKNDESMDFTV